MTVTSKKKPSKDSMSLTTAETAGISRRPSNNSKEILLKQKDALISAIQEADSRETKRISRINRTKKQELKVNLELRFEYDRIADQNKIKYLIHDYKILKERIDCGSPYKSLLQKETRCPNLATRTGESSYKSTVNKTKNNNVRIIYMSSFVFLLLKRVSYIILLSIQIIFFCFIFIFT